MTVVEILGRLPRRFEKSEFLKICALFDSDISGQIELYARLPSITRAELQWRIYRRLSTKLELDPTKIFLPPETYLSDLSRLNAAYRIARSIPIGQMTRDVLRSLHETALPDFKTARFRDQPGTMFTYKYAEGSDYYRKNFSKTGCLVSLSPDEIAKIPVHCRWARWEFAKIESFPECLRSQLPNHENKRWIATWLPDPDVIGAALEDWLKKFNAGPPGSPGGWAAALYAEFCQIHPFNDGNGRVGAILFNSLLAQLNFPSASLSVPDFSNPFPPRSIEALDNLVQVGRAVFAREIFKKVLWHHAQGNLISPKTTKIGFWEQWAEVD